MSEYIIKLTEDQYNLLTRQLEEGIEASGDVDDIRNLVDLLETLEKDFYFEEEKD